MADVYKGLTIQFGAETTGLDAALKNISTRANAIGRELGQVNKLLKLDPKNTELLGQKQTVLAEKIATTRQKLDALKQSQSQIDAMYKSGEIDQGTYRKFQREIAATEAELKRLEATGKRSAAEIAKAMQDTGKKMVGVGKTMTTYVSAPILAVDVLLAKLASNSVTSERLFSTSFGKMAGSVRAWSEQTSKDMGLNAYTVRQSVANMNLSFKGLGIPDSVSADMSEKLTKIAYDFQALGKGDAADVSKKFVSGVLGMTKGLKTLGIGMDNTSIEAYAYTHGIAKATVDAGKLETAQLRLQKATADYNAVLKKHSATSLEAKLAADKVKQAEDAVGKALEGNKTKLTLAQSAQARYGLILQETTAIQGAWAKAADDPNEKLARLKQRADDVGIAFGMQLLPEISRGIDLLTSLTNKLADTDGTTKAWILALGLAVAAIGPIVIGLGSFIEAIGSVITFGGALVGALSAMATGVGGLAVAMTGLDLAAGPVGWAILAIGAVLVGGGVIAAMNSGASAADNQAGAMMTAAGAARAQKTALDELRGAEQTLATASANLTLAQIAAKQAHIEAATAARTYGSASDQAREASARATLADQQASSQKDALRKAILGAESATSAYGSATDAARAATDRQTAAINGLRPNVGNLAVSLHQAQAPAYGLADGLHSVSSAANSVTSAADRAAAALAHLRSVSAGASGVGPHGSASTGHAAGAYFTSGSEYALIGEGGYTEAVISTDPAYRAANVSAWERVGQMLGAWGADMVARPGSAASSTVNTNTSHVTNISLAGATIAPSVPDGRVSTFKRELASELRAPVIQPG